MTSEEMEARLVVLEVIASQAVIAAIAPLAIESGTAGVVNFLDEVRATALLGVRRLRPEVRAAAEPFLDDFLARVSGAFAGYPPPSLPTDDSGPA